MLLNEKYVYKENKLTIKLNKIFVEMKKHLKMAEVKKCSNFMLIV